MRVFLTILLFLVTTASHADTVRGRALVIDGDTLEINNRRVRIEGIDAFELAQTCVRANGRRWDCGAEGKVFLLRLTRNKTVRCSGNQTDAYGRLIAQCSVGRADIGKAMVDAGLAMAFVKYSQTYVLDQQVAQANGAGIWAGSFTAPWDYRAEKWETAAQSTPNADCPIKGNVSDNGRIYHMPYSRWYDRTRIDTSKGERWFCSESEARAAGWVASRSR